MTEALEFIEVGGKKFKVIKKGREQAEQVLEVTKWLSNYGIRAIQNMQAEKTDTQDGVVFLTKLVEGLTPDSIIDLFKTLVGCSAAEAEEHFDIGILIDVLVNVYNHQPAVKRLIERFFSEPNSEELEE